MSTKLPDLPGYLLIHGETIGVLYSKGKTGTVLKMRPLRGVVLGVWLKDESQKLAHGNPIIRRKLRALRDGKIIQL